MYIKFRLPIEKLIYYTKCFLQFHDKPSRVTSECESFVEGRGGTPRYFTSLDHGIGRPPTLIWAVGSFLEDQLRVKYIAWIWAALNFIFHRRHSLICFTTNLNLSELIQTGLLNNVFSLYFQVCTKSLIMLWFVSISRYKKHFPWLWVIYTRKYNLPCSIYKMQQNKPTNKTLSDQTSRYVMCQTPVEKT
jgi:hypothetical protein